jgi:ATP-dependent DNA helicase RecG
MLSARELLDQLNSLDECSYIEAKQASKIDKSIMESVCAFANEPNLGGGYLLLGVKRVEEGVIFPYYEPVGLDNLDKIQSDFASQCATTFNLPLRPVVKSDILNGKAVIVIYVPESSQKPVFFSRQNLPGGAFRRIAGTDQRCTEDDLLIFYQNGPSYDVCRQPKVDRCGRDAGALKREETVLTALYTLKNMTTAVGRFSAVEPSLTA